MLMKAADLDGDGTINYEEFVACTVSLAKLEQEDAYMRAFQHFDKVRCVVGVAVCDDTIMSTFVCVRVVC